MATPTSGGIVAFIEDLMFLSRIREAAQSAGLRVHAVRDPAMLVETCRVNRPAVVFVDLDSTRLASLEAVATLRAAADVAMIPIIGFLGHTETERAEAARAAGCTRVLTRGAFVNELHSLIPPPPRSGD
jgi:CheY-like chemotaxis protein